MKNGRDVVWTYVEMNRLKGSLVVFKPRLKTDRELSPLGNAYNGDINLCEGSE